jgi:Rad3-related DNA helicase
VEPANDPPDPTKSLALERSPSLRDHFPFAEVRENQNHTLDRLVEWNRSSKKFFLLEGPTGFGKSPCNIAEASYAKVMPGFGQYEPGAYILTPQKTLAEQYMRDFEPMGLVELKGRANYPCGKWTQVTGEQVDCETGAMLNESGMDDRCDWCPYRAAKERFVSAPFGTTNFAYYLSETNHAHQLPDRNLLVLDEGHNTEECHPPETKIDICADIEGVRRQKTAKIQSVAIALLSDGQRAVSWNRASDSLHLSGREIRVAHRPYAGPLLTVTAGDKSTRVTPNHWFWVRLNSSVSKKHILYIMHKEGYGYRIGVTRFRSASQHGIGLVSRMKQEEADKGWVLALYDSYSEAAKWEKIYSLRYGIADTCFRARKGVLQSDIKDVFLSTSEDGAIECLKAHGRQADYPIWENTSRPKHKGYFKIRACNLLSGVMELPARKTKTRGERRRNVLDASTTIGGISVNQYTGLVYSLDVAEDHTYVADGLVVGNCILKLTDTKIDRRRCDEYGVGRLPVFGEGDNSAVLAWLDSVFVPAALACANELAKKFREARDDERVKYARKIKALERFLQRIDMFRNSNDPGEWFAWSDWQENLRTGKASGTGDLLIKPLTARLFADDLLFSKAQKVLITSATILDFGTFMRNLGISPRDAEILAVDSEFPVANRPLFYDPVGSMNYRDIDRTLPLLATKIEELMVRYASKKGIVHTNSYKVNQYVTRYLSGTSQAFRVVTHDSSYGARERAQTEHFARTGEPTVLFSPSMFEGLDLKEDLSRFQIICKVPYPALDPYVRARMRRDPAWYQWQTALKLVQASGRSVRSKTDKAHTWILDEEFANFIQRNNRSMPKYWLNSIIW